MLYIKETQSDCRTRKFYENYGPLITNIKTKHPE